MIPMNIASYALLMHIVGKLTGYKPRYFIHTLGNAHIYSNHIEQCKIILERDPFPLPELLIDTSFVDKIGPEFDFKKLGYTYNEYGKYFKVLGYQHQGVLKGKLSTGLK